MFWRLVKFIVVQLTIKIIIPTNNSLDLRIIFIPLVMTYSAKNSIWYSHWKCGILSIFLNLFSPTRMIFDSQWFRHLIIDIPQWYPWVLFISVCVTCFKVIFIICFGFSSHVLHWIWWKVECYVTKWWKCIWVIRTIPYVAYLTNMGCAQLDKYDEVHAQRATYKRDFGS